MGKFDNFLCTKYTGVVEAGKGSGAVPQFKTGVNSRLPLTERVAHLHSAADDDFLDSARDADKLRSKIAAIDASAKDVALQRRHADGGTIQQTSIVSTVRSVKDVPPRAHMWTAPGDGKLTNIPMAHCKTVHQTSTDGYVHNKDAQFLSRVRQIEKVDDDERAAQVKANARADEKANLRSAAVVHKRETDVRFAPPPMQFDRIIRAVPNAVKANASDSVKFTHAPVPSHYDLEMANPQQRLAECKAAHDDRADASLLRNELALDAVSGCVDLQAGSAKDFDHIVSSGYGGHCPAHPRNIAMVKGPEKEMLRSYSKSVIGLVGAAHRQKSIYSLLPSMSEARAEEAQKKMEEKNATAPKVTSASMRHALHKRGF